MNLKKLSILFLSTIFLVLNFSYAGTAENLKTIDDLIAKNDIKSAKAQLEAALKTSANDIELLMRQCRVVTIEGDQAASEDDKVKAYENAQELATKMIELDGNNAKGYIRRSIAKGKIALYKGLLQSRSLVLEIRKDTEKALSLSGISAYDKSLASYILGRAHLKLAKKPKALRLPLGLAWASKEKGSELLKTAVTGSPTSVAFNLAYGKYLKENDDKAQAKTYLEKVGTLPVFDPADVQRKAEAKKLLADL